MRIGMGQVSAEVFVPVNYPGFGPMGAGSTTAIATLTGDDISTTETDNPVASQVTATQAAVPAIPIVAAAAPATSLPPPLPSPNAPTPLPFGNPPTPLQTGPNAGIQILTPQSIVSPFPDLTGAVAPNEPAPSLWCQLNTAIADQPVISIAVLAGIAILLWPKGKRR